MQPKVLKRQEGVGQESQNEIKKGGLFFQARSPFFGRKAGVYDGYHLTGAGQEFQADWFLKITFQRDAETTNWYEVLVCFCGA